MRPVSQIILIGGSASSLEVLLQIVPALQQKNSVPIVFIIHRGGGRQSAMFDIFSEKTRMTVREIEDKDDIQSNHIYIAPGDYHLLFEKNHSFSLDDSEKVNFSRPSIDISFQSAADIYGKGTIGILLSGANSDGTLGLLSIKEAGGTTIVQSPATATVPLMPEHAIKNVSVDFVFEVPQIIEFINAI